MKKRVYIAGPIVKGELGGNIQRAVDAMHALMRAGFAPHCPHLSCYSGNVSRSAFGSPFAFAEVLPRGTKVEEWYGVDMPWVEVSEAVLRLPGEGVGSDAEVAHAESLGIPVFHSLGELIAWGRQQAAV